MQKQAVRSNLSTASPTSPGSNLPALLCTARHQKEDTQTLELGSQTPCWGHTAWSHDHDVLRAHVPCPHRSIHRSLHGAFWGTCDY